MPVRPAYGAELVGKVIDITYTDSNETYRVKIVGYDRDSFWHEVDSTGYSVWHDDEDGDDTFTDKIDLNSMNGLSRVDFIDDAELERDRLELEAEIEDKVPTEDNHTPEVEPRDVEEAKQSDQQAQ